MCINDQIACISASQMHSNTSENVFEMINFEEIVIDFADFILYTARLTGCLETTQ